MGQKKLINLLLLIILLFFATLLDAQKYFTKTGEITFYSNSPVENIEAISSSANSVFDSESGLIQWAVLIKSFEFEKALMQEHFNENYMESSKFPKAKFSGTIENISKIKFDVPGDYIAKVKGKLEIHGVDQEIETEATFTISDNKIKGFSEFKVLVSDYNIKIPKVVKNNIAKEILISISADYELFE